MTYRHGNIRRFKVNPVELAIFAAVSLIFGHSLFTLFTERSHLHGPQFTDSQNANDPSESSVSRSPASVQPPFLHVNVGCEVASIQQETHAGRLRVTGTLCGKSPAKTVVINESNHYLATVFSDKEAGRYSTDYIPLNTGKNSVRVETSFSDGTSAVRELILSRQ